MKGNIQQRGPRTWRLRYDVPSPEGREPAVGVPSQPKAPARKLAPTDADALDAGQDHGPGRRWDRGGLRPLALLVIRINATDVDDVVDVPYSRSTRSGSIGALFRDFARGRFIEGV